MCASVCMHVDGFNQNFDWWQIWQSYMSSDSSGPCLSSGFGPIAIVRYSDLAKCCSLVTGTCVCFFLQRQSRVVLRGQVFEDFAKTLMRLNWGNCFCKYLLWRRLSWLGCWLLASPWGWRSVFWCPWGWRSMFWCPWPILCLLFFLGGSSFLWCWRTSSYYKKYLHFTCILILYIVFKSNTRYI